MTLLVKSRFFPPKIAHVLMKRKKNILRSWVCNQNIFKDRSQFAAWQEACYGESKANTVTKQ